MKNTVLLIVIFFFTITGMFTAQPKIVFKKHLFLGTWQLISDKHNITEEWSYINDTLYKGRTYILNGNDTSIIETLQLKYIDNIFCYCTTVPDQNEGKEIIYKLKHIENQGEKLTFENPSHDYPKKIVYQFSQYNQMTSSIEGIESGIVKKKEYYFEKVPSQFDEGIFYGRLKREQFVNKAGRAIDGVYDYFFIIEETPYFICFKDSKVTLSELEKYLDKEIRLWILFRWGLWDTDDENVQSRIGRYIKILGIIYD